MFLLRWEIQGQQLSRDIWSFGEGCFSLSPNDIASDGVRERVRSKQNRNGSDIAGRKHSCAISNSCTVP